MKTANIAVFMTLLTSLAFACPTILSAGIATQSDCSDAVPAELATVYAGEDFYVCGTLSEGGVTLSAQEADILPQQSAVAAADGKFMLAGRAAVQEHRVYYIPITSPGCEYTPVRVLVKTECKLVPPSTVVAVPDAVEQSGKFTVMVANSDRDVAMEISGLSRPVETIVHYGQSYSEEFNATECCEEAECSCQLRFTFTDTKHSICANDDTSFAVKVVEDRPSAITGLDTLAGAAFSGLLILLMLVPLGIFILRGL